MSFQHMSAGNRQAELGQRSVRIPPIPMIIRFENHLFYSDWGQQPPEQIFQHFDGDKLHRVAERVKLRHETPALAAFEPNARRRHPSRRNSMRRAIQADLADATNGTISERGKLTNKSVELAQKRPCLGVR